MPHSSSARSSTPRLRGVSNTRSMGLWLLLAALLVLALGGGSNRTDVFSLVYVRPALVLIVTGMALLAKPHDLLNLKWPLGMMLAAIVLLLLQLVPLPPAIWMHLPNRDLVAEAAIAQGTTQPWRPLSMTPDLTLQSLLWFLAPAAALIGWSLVQQADYHRFFNVFVGFLIADAVLGGLQTSQGTGSPLYLYNRTYEGFAVGFLANRNHQATLLALCFPIIRLWSLAPARKPRVARRRVFAMAAGMLLLIPSILLTGSRAGLVLSGLGLVLSLAIAPLHDIRAAIGRAGRYLPVIFAAVSAALALLIAFLGRALSFTRLMENNVEDDLRVRYAPLIFRMAKDNFLVGSGFGSFDPLFRTIEPDNVLKPTFFNHAHNDFLETIIGGGVITLLLILIGLTWWATTGFRIFRDKYNGRFQIAMARAGWCMVLITMLASLVDYPLRAPLFAFIFSLAVAWMVPRKPSPDS